jgi:hypothetical protein
MEIIMTKKVYKRLSTVDTRKQSRLITVEIVSEIGEHDIEAEVKSLLTRINHFAAIAITENTILDQTFKKACKVLHSRGTDKL